MGYGKTILARDDVMDGVPEMIAGGPGRGDVSGRDQARHRPPADPMTPGEVIPADGRASCCNAGRADDASAIVTNTGDRPIQVGSHYHFFEVNRALRFDRAAGLRVCGWTSRPGRRCASSPASSARAAGRARRPAHRARPERAGQRIARRLMPAVRARARSERASGRLVQVARTARATPRTSGRQSAIASGWRIRTARRSGAGSHVYGEEAVFGGGKVIRDGMGQGRATHAAVPPTW